MTFNIKNSQIGFILVNEERNFQRPKLTEAWEQKLYYRSDTERLRQYAQVKEWLPVESDIRRLSEKLAEESDRAGANFAPEKYGIYKVSVQEILKSVSLDQAADTAALMSVIQWYGQLERFGPESPLRQSINALDTLKDIFARASEMNPVEDSKELLHKGFVASRTTASHLTQYCSRNSHDEHQAQRKFLQKTIEEDFRRGLAFVKPGDVENFRMSSPPRQLSGFIAHAEHFKDPVEALKAVTFFKDESPRFGNDHPGNDKFNVIQVSYLVDRKPMTQAEIETEKLKSFLTFMKPDYAATVMKLVAKPLSF